MKTTKKTEPAKNYLRFWRDLNNVNQQAAEEIQSLPGYDGRLGLLDNVLRLGYGNDALEAYNKARRPAFEMFRDWARKNLPDA
jgi:hypothetical protein